MEIKPNGFTASSVHGFVSGPTFLSYTLSDRRLPAGLRCRQPEFTEDSLAFHLVGTMACESRPAMKENIVIPIKIERVKAWTRWTLETATWLICFGLLAASVVVAGCAALAWLVSGSEVILTLGLGGGLLLGLAGVWHLLRKLDRTVNHLRPETPVVG
jgi:hypothetical protein